MKTQQSLTFHVVSNNFLIYKQKSQQGIIKILFLLLFIFICNVPLMSQIQYDAPDYHQFNMTNYNGFVKIGMNALNAEFDTDKTGFQFNKPIYSNCPIYTNLLTRDNGILEIISPQDLYLLANGDLYLNSGNINMQSVVNMQSNVFMSFNNSFTLGNTISQDYPRLRITHTGIHAYVDYQDNLYFRANKNWISALTLFGNGTIGIGFSTSYDAGDYRNMGYKLAVNGGIICEEVKVIADVPDADYVFEKDYKLLSLRELESFIQTHKHLPDIPSSEAFKTNGYNVGEMDEMLLRKIEELTLYIIDLEKQIHELKHENSKGGE